MQGLILETSTNLSGLILTTDSKSLAFIPMDGGEKLSKSLGVQVQALLTAYPQFKADFVAVGQGPGSLTGIRIGMALGRALAFGWGVPCTTFCSLRLFVSQTDEDFAVLVDARSGGMYCLEQGEREPRLLQPDQIPNCRLISPHPDIIKKRLDRPVFAARLKLDNLASIDSF
jgi:tRNA threonylcarbamoyl adenosine modification protein YeaZ